MMKMYEGEILASYALFREIYNSDCKNIYDIVVEFVKDAIVTNAKYSFTLNEITSLVNKSFEFNIPDYVISPSIMKIDGIIKKNGEYYTSKPITGRSVLFEKHQNELINNNNNIINELCICVEEMNGKRLLEQEKKLLIISFYAFLLDEVNGQEYYEHISAFVIKNKKNDNFVKQLELIREGVVLYTGINYNSRINEIGSWKNELVVYLEMEILFHIAGYNGVIFNELADELLMLMGNAKNKKHKRLIKLKYFSETKDQIERFFDKAEYIVNGQSVLDIDNIAMKEIINGCKTSADIIDKKSDFYMLLNNKGIALDDNNYYDSNLTQHNLEDAATLEHFTCNEDDDSDEIHKRLKFISNINKLRQGQVKGDYADCGYLLVTNTTKTLKMSKTLAYQNSTVPYAVSMATLTNILWNRLNVGFGAKDFPKSIDVILKAQIILSKFVNKSVSESYMKLKEEVKDKSITEEQMLLRLTNLRSLVKKPEDIGISDCDNTLLFFTEDKMEKFIQEQEKYKTKVSESERITTELKNEVEVYKNGYEALKQKIVIKDKLDLKYVELDNINLETNNLIKLKENLDSMFHRKYRNSIVLCCICIILFYGVYIEEIIRHGWSEVEMIVYLLSLVPPAIGYIYTVTTTKSFNIISLLSAVKLRCKKSVFKNNPKLDDVIYSNTLKIDGLGREINNLTKDLNKIDQWIEVRTISIM